jgi:hypothetical protein
LALTIPVEVAMEHEQTVNRMSEKPDLEPLRGSSMPPSWWERRAARVIRTIRGRTGVTVMLAITIVIALAVGVWVIL